MPLCQHCYQEIASQTIAAHEQACARRPSDAELTDEYARGTIASLTRKYKVSHSTVKTWLENAGIKPHEGLRGCKPPVRACWELSVLEPQAGGCDGCDWHSVCRQRVARKSPVLCEAPLASEVLAWQLAGWLPVDITGAALK